MINCLKTFSHHYFCQRSGYTLGKTRNNCNASNNINKVISQQQHTYIINSLKITKRGLIQTIISATSFNPDCHKIPGLEVNQMKKPNSSGIR